MQTFSGVTPPGTPPAPGQGMATSSMTSPSTRRSVQAFPPTAVQDVDLDAELDKILGAGQLAAGRATAPAVAFGEGEGAIPSSSFMASPICDPLANDGNFNFVPSHREDDR